MPTKRNWAGEQQEYIPAGSSKGGEYAGGSGLGGAKFDGKVEQDFNDPRLAKHNLAQERDFEVKTEPQYDTENKRIVESFKNETISNKQKKLQEKGGTQYENINLDLSNPIHRLNDTDRLKYRTEKNAEGYDIAEKLIKKYEPNVDTIANDILGVTEQQGGIMVGLDFRLKRPDSLTRKLYADVREAKEKGQTITLQDAANKMGDVARFTSCFEPKDFQKGADAVIRSLQQKGYELVKFKNYFQPGSSYKGLNCNFKDKNGNIFELQFHTPETMKIKEGYEIDIGKRKAVMNNLAFQSHDIYETTRVLEDKQRKNEITDDEVIKLNALKEHGREMWNPITYSFPNWTIDNYKQKQKNVDDYTNELFKKAKVKTFTSQKGKNKDGDIVEIRRFGKGQNAIRYNETKNVVEQVWHDGKRII